VSIQPSDLAAAASRESFNVARRRAFIQDILAELSGRPENLLSFSDVTEQLHLQAAPEEMGLQEIPLRAIVGSVGRYKDFNRTFLPRRQISPERWARIDSLRRQSSLAPIDVFKIGDVYFVQDGNHRVSVARARGDRTIQARVVEIPTRVPLGPTTSPDDLILKAGYTEFLERTSLDRTCPGQRIELTKPGGYWSLQQHIEIHQFYVGLRSQGYPDMAEAAADWYHNVYGPVVDTIRSSGILKHFPGRTEADLYLWIAENRARLQMRYGDSDKAREAVDDFARENWVPPFRRWLRRLRQRIFPRLRAREPEPRPPRMGRPPTEKEP
jgi:hypothetical protein